MDKSLIDEIRACLPQGRTLFHYFKDRYALMLLAYMVGESAPLSRLRAGRAARLLEKPTVRSLLAQLGHAHLDRLSLTSMWPADTHTFLLTLDQWGGGRGRWYQTSRPGYNLVLQLNFSHIHDSVYRQLVRPACSAHLNSWSHPVLREGRRELFRETLAWARLDVDFDTGEALIEEIQSDWVRGADGLRRAAERARERGPGCLRYWEVDGLPEAVIEYVDKVLAPYRRLWAEAMLAAAIMFLREELGLRVIYYHSHDTGSRVKGMGGWLPPRSLYTDLPRRFCFEETRDCPAFLLGDKGFVRKYRRVADPRWQRLEL